MSAAEELYSLFLRNFPYITREEATARRLLADSANRVLSRRDAEGRLFAAAVVHKNNILLLAVDAPYRAQGVGSSLLSEAESLVRAQGYDSVTIGVGEDYLCPGVPVREKPFPEALLAESLDPRIPADNAAFFLRRGYAHSWGQANCFDMRVSMADARPGDFSLGDTLSGITYRWAEPQDMPCVCACTDDAEPGFTQYYASAELYRPDAPQRALIALDGPTVVGALIVSRETEGEGLGSVGCTAVRNAWQGRKIATNMILLGVHTLREAGMREAYLGYTYSGLDKLYGRAGYSVSALYFMAKKDLSTPELRLAERKEAHVRAFFSAMQSPVLRAALPLKARSLDEALADYRASLLPGADSFGRTVYHGDAYIGDIWCHSIAPAGEPQAMLSYCIFDRTFWNRGVATHAVSLFLREIEQRFGLRRVGAFAYLANSASVRVLEKNGFRLVEQPDTASGYFLRTGD